MANYYVNGNSISIQENEQIYAQGSEGKIYFIEDKAYKIYYPNALNEGFGDKKKYHQALLEIQDFFEYIILPEHLIFDGNQSNSYCGYTTKWVGDGNKQKEGITTLSWNLLIHNLAGFEREIHLLGKNRFLAVDFSFHNLVFSDKEQKLYMVDPGRYHHTSYFTLDDYHRRNQCILKTCILHMLERDILHFHLLSSKKVKIFLNHIELERKNLPFSEYFSENEQKYSNIQEMIKVKEKFLH